MRNYPRISARESLHERRTDDDKRPSITHRRGEESRDNHSRLGKVTPRPSMLISRLISKERFEEG